MTLEEAHALTPGIYLLEWNNDVPGGEVTLAAIGGVTYRWYQPIEFAQVIRWNFNDVPDMADHWECVRSVKLILDKNDLREEQATLSQLEGVCGGVSSDE